MVKKKEVKKTSSKKEVIPSPPVERDYLKGFTELYGPVIGKKLFQYKEEVSKNQL